MASLLRLKDICKTYDQLAAPVTVLGGVDLNMDRGDDLSIMGPSGSGKSTLLHIIGTLDQPSSGTLSVDGVNPFQLSEPELARFRNETMGFVFQDHHLLPQYSVLENVLIPTHAHGGGPDREDRARMLLGRVGLERRLDHRPAELSGGERQRVAIARALINNPLLLLCDEPTGNLDEKTAAAVSELLFDLHREEQNLLILVTHSRALGTLCQKQGKLAQGRLLLDQVIVTES